MSNLKKQWGNFARKNRASADIWSKITMTGAAISLTAMKKLWVKEIRTYWLNHSELRYILNTSFYLSGLGMRHRLRLQWGNEEMLQHPRQLQGWSSHVQGQFAGVRHLPPYPRRAKPSLSCVTHQPSTISHHEIALSSPYKCAHLWWQCWFVTGILLVSHCM